MATLTWRDVAAPDFRTSLAAFESFRSGINDAVVGAQQGLARFDADQTDQVNRAFALELAKFSDPDQLNAALAKDPTLGLDARRVSAANLTGARNLVTTLLQQKDTAGDIKFEQYGRDRTMKQNTALDTVTPTINAAMTLAAQGKDSEAQALIANDPNTRNLTAEQFNSVLTNSLGLTKSNVGIAGERQDQKFQATAEARDATRFGWDTTRYNDERQGIEMANQIINDAAGGSPEDVMAAYSKYASQYGAGAANYARGRLGEMGFNAFASMGGGSSGAVDMSGGTAGGDAATVMNYQARAAGFASVPDTVKTLGQAVQFGQQTNSAQRARGVARPSSAMGLYQITEETFRDFAPKVFGQNWKNQAFTPENQDKVGAAIYAWAQKQPNPVQALRNRWSSLNDAEAKSLVGKPWQQGRQLIAAGESNGNPASLLAQSNLAPVVLAKESAEVNRNSISTKIAPALNDNSTPFEVATRLRGNSFKGVPQDFLEKKLKDIMQKTGANASTAAVMLEQNRITNNPDEWNLRNGVLGTIGKIMGTITPQLGNSNMTIDDDALNRTIKDYKDKGPNGIIGQVANNQNLSQMNANIQSTRQVVGQAQARLVQARRAKELNPRLDISRYERDFASAQASLEMALAAVRSR